MKILGVDISEHNGNVDFNMLKSAGVKFVIIRCGYGNDSFSQDDSCYFENVKKAEAVNMPWGVYLYSYATNTDMAKSEAAHTVRLLQGKKPPYGVWYDVEDNSQSGADLVSVCDIYCKTMEAAGVYCGIYSMVSWLENKLNSSRLDRYDKWVAQWSSSCQYSKPYGIWQCTDNLVIGGKAFDGNYAYKDYPALTGNKKKEEPELTEAQVKKILAAEVKKLVADEARKIVQDEIAKHEKAVAGKPVSGWAKAAWDKAAAAGIFDGTAPRGVNTREMTAVEFDRLGLLDDGK